MTSEKKDSSSKEIRNPQKIEQGNINNAGILKEKDKKDLEDRIVETLKKLNGKLTKKEILALFSKVEASKGLDGLRNELEKESKLGGQEISEEMLQDILDLIREAKEIAQKGIDELKLELKKVLNETKEYELDKSIYLSSRFSFIKKLEKSELGKSIILDIAGITVGALDSAQAIFKLLLGLIKDLILLPRDIVRSIKK
ncbi:MAG: hypothetical protein PHS92_04425 [Candidatus Gracilibacteria bacterium]|nr:hypothetical protein [Candidatus Gracilibacteria bacterium]